jgi:hypothetical protein
MFDQYFDIWLWFSMHIFSLLGMGWASFFIREMGRTFTNMSLMALSKRGMDAMLGVLFSLAFMIARRFSMMLRSWEFPGHP